MSRRIAFLVYGLTCYAIFFAVFLYSIAFIGNFDIVPKTIDSGEKGPLALAIAINLGLLTVFAVQHSGMARPAFKRWWTRIVPEPAERATYVLLTSVILAVTYFFWQPIDGVVWEASNSTVASGLTALYLGGWALLLYATVLIDHFDLFGVRQSWLAFRGREYTHHAFGTPGLYKHVRHPIYVAWFVIMWATPMMSAAHFLFALVSSAYIVLAVFAEEHDLVEHFGDAYRQYQSTTPKYMPRPRRAVVDSEAPITG